MIQLLRIVIRVRSECFTQFKKIKNFFVGIDSDGTVFDSMNIKHTRSFIPAAVQIFGLEKCACEFTKIAEHINLFSLKRGINRFPGQYLALKQLQDDGLCEFYGLEDFKDFINSEYPMSNAGLKKWLEKNPSDFNRKVLSWSELGDQYFEEQTKNLEPFDGVWEAIVEMKSQADIMVVSSASSDSLLKDWSRTGLDKITDFIAGQEFGSKTDQLNYAKSKGFTGDKMLMIGDAPGDYAAAKKAGARFYPIIPGRECECWSDLKNKYFHMFTSGKYTDETQADIYNKFINLLKG